MGLSMENILMNHRMQGYWQIHQSVAEILLMTALPSNFGIFHGGNTILLGLARNRLIGRFPWQYPGLGRIRLCVIVGSPTISRENDETQQCFHCHLYLLRFPPKTGARWTPPPGSSSGASTGKIFGLLRTAAAKQVDNLAEEEVEEGVSFLCFADVFVGMSVQIECILPI